MSDYDNEWDGELDMWHGPYSRQSVRAWFTALQWPHVPVDALYLRSRTTLEELARYRVLIYPHPAIMSDTTAEVLAEYVRQGGTIVFGARTGYKDGTGKIPMRPLPGPVAELCGVRVTDWTRIGPDEAGPALRWSDTDRVQGSAQDFADIVELITPGAEVVAEYGGDYYAGTPALVRNSTGAGSAWYFGSVFNVDSVSALLERLGLASPVAGWLELPHAVELAVRERQETGERLVFLLNYSGEPQTITLHRGAVDLLSARQLEGTVALEPFAVQILAPAGEHFVEAAGTG